MLRAAAKNYRFVTVVVDPADYGIVLEEMKAEGDTTEATRFQLAAKVFSHTASYDALIGNYLWKKAQLPKYPDTVTLTFEKAQGLRYGENPHQAAAYYREMKVPAGTIAGAVQLHGKELSFNNINDANAALETLKEFDEPAAVALKHANPCGVGTGNTIYEAYLKAYEGDPVSIFGGIVALNREVDEKTAAEINKIFVEIVIAPSYSEKALNILKSKKNIRVMQLDDISAITKDAIDIKKVGGGLLIQDIDWEDFKTDDIKYVTDRRPTEKEMQDMLFAWKVVKHVKSNAIVVAKDGTVLGVGPGQTNRIWSAEMSLERSGDKVKGAVMASDAFFPFSDVVEAAAKAGVTAIIQPGGSVRDQESIDACNRNGIAMIFTGVRHFKH
jgi:phosphoribosylaminoimidazolecarboxamide formyltransferase/IMP cyclohydrolase